MNQRSAPTQALFLLAALILAPLILTACARPDSASPPSDGTGQTEWSLSVGSDCPSPVSDALLRLCEDVADLSGGAAVLTLQVSPDPLRSGADVVYAGWETLHSLEELAALEVPTLLPGQKEALSALNTSLAREIIDAALGEDYETAAILAAGRVFLLTGDGDLAARVGSDDDETLARLAEDLLLGPLAPRPYDPEPAPEPETFYTAGADRLLSLKAGVPEDMTLLNLTYQCRVGALLVRADWRERAGPKTAAALEEASALAQAACAGAWERLESTLLQRTAHVVTPSSRLRRALREVRSGQDPPPAVNGTALYRFIEDSVS